MRGSVSKLKTELTKKIERALFDWSPTTIGGIKINTMRGGFAATEVPVENGTTRSGLVDYVWVTECLMDIQTVGKCALYFEHRKKTDDTILEFRKNAARRAGCPEADKDEYISGEKLCDNKECRCHMNAREARNEVLITCVEIKITKSDFKSKHGHNFCGNCNYYAMPKELYPEVKDLIPDGVGVLLFYGAENEEQKKRANPFTDFSYYGIKTKVQPAYKPLDEETQKWLILSVAKRMRKETLTAYDELLSSGGKQSQETLDWI